ncbi:MAG TPA: M1 family aminopeptidase [Bacteroidia bacterium]|jgi:ABC-2 type transport system permease protein
MFKEIFLFELKLWLKKPATYIFFLVFFAMAMFVTALSVGLIGSASDSNIIINSAKAIAENMNGINTDLIGIMILITIIAPAIYKDFQYNMHPLLFTTPITKPGYIFGRFLAAFLVALIAISGTVAGHVITCAIPGIEAERLGAFQVTNYIQPFVLFVIPNTLLVGAIFFSVVSFSRNMVAGYIGAIIFLILKNIAPILLADIDNKNLSALLDPFGEQALSVATQYWSTAEQNSNALPFSGIVMYNRLLWMVVACGIGGLTFYRFQFSQFNNPVSFSFLKRKKEAIRSISSAPLLSLGDVPKVSQDFSLRFHIHQVWFLAKFEYLKIIKSIFFLIIAALCALVLTLVSPVYTQMYGTPTYPVTYQILEISTIIFMIFAPILIVFYSGIVVWREKDSKVDELVGASPIPSWTSFLSKLLGLSLMQVTLLFIIMLTGIFIQLYNNFYEINVLLYFKELFGFRLIGLILLCILSMSIQVLFSQKFIGLIISAILIVVLPLLAASLGWDSGLIQFNSNGPRIQYSDMNGFGHTVFAFIIFKLYWLSFGFILIIFSSLLWARGKEKGFKARFKSAKGSFTRNAKWGLSLSTIAFILFGSFIYYNTNVLNKRISNKQKEKAQVEFEKKYKRYSKTPQPRVIAANWNVDIYPEELGTRISGYYFIKNKTNKPIDSLLLNIYSEINLTLLDFSSTAKLAMEDKENGFRIYTLAKALLPGDSMKVNMAMDYFPKGFKNSDPDVSILYNGTFFNSGFLPSFGYNEGAELSDESARKKHGLAKKVRMANVDDSLARMNTYISSDADWINFECTLSTSKDQIAIAPGYLLKEWEQDGRRYFHYKMDCKILNFYSFLSARYEVKRDTWKDVSGAGKDVAIEIYYNKGHEYNIDKMINGVKRSLDYYSKNFSPYQHRQVRILEFARPHGRFAQSFPNTIPFSEGIGFIAKIDTADAESIDFPFYVTAHEVAHQWWAHQVIGGNVQGAAVMSETMSQYSALMVMEKEFGRQAMKKFLKYEMNKYLEGRAFGGKKELPLMKVEDQSHVYYQKGSVVMYALRDYIGEDSLNAALAKYIKKVAYQEPPFTNSVEFLDFIKAATPDSLKYIINDMFETITLYENKTTKCSYTKMADGKYKVKISVNCKKMKADSLGKMKDVKVADWMDVGVFGSKSVNGKKTETELYLQKRKIDKEKMEFEIIVSEEPVKVGVDPYNKLIDRTPDNNTRLFTDTAPAEDAGDTQAITIGVKE